MNKVIALALAAVLLPGISLAQSAEKHQCTYGDMVRRVELLYETADSVPCEVQYFKDTEAPGERYVLWSATSESGYCEQKTSEFLGKLRDWGWDCGQGEDTVPEIEEEAGDEAEPVDDTDALSAGDDQ